jgi:hypothetical protein
MIPNGLTKGIIKKKIFFKEKQQGKFKEEH